MKNREKGDISHDYYGAQGRFHIADENSARYTLHITLSMKNWKELESALRESKKQGIERYFADTICEMIQEAKSIISRDHYT